MKTEGKWTVEVIPDSRAGDVLVQLVQGGRLIEATRVTNEDEADARVTEWARRRGISSGPATELAIAARKMVAVALKPKEARDAPKKP